MEYATHSRFGGLGLKTIDGRFGAGVRVSRFGPQNPGGASKETRRHVVESWRLRRGDGKSKQEAGPSDQLVIG